MISTLLKSYVQRRRKATKTEQAKLWQLVFLVASVLQSRICHMDCSKLGGEPFESVSGFEPQAKNWAQQAVTLSFACEFS